MSKGNSLAELGKEGMSPLLAVFKPASGETPDGS